MTTRSTRSPHAETTLVDRYVHAATHRLPEDQRDDIAAELRASIVDRVESLREEHAELGVDEVERAALVELGDPVRLAAGYSGQTLQLIGPAVYPSYVRVLKAILVAVVPVTTIVVAVIDSVEGESVGAVIGGAAWMAFTVAVQIAFWVTLAFVLAERGGASDGVRRSLCDEWTPEQLPELPRGLPGSVAELATNLVWLGFLGAAIVWQQFRSPVQDAVERLPLLDPDLWSFWLPLILVLIVVEMVFEVVKYRAGGWTPRLATINVLMGACFAAPLVYLAASDKLFNPAAVAEIQDGWPDFDAGTASTVVVISALIIWTWDGVDGWRKVRSA